MNEFLVGLKMVKANSTDLTLLFALSVFCLDMNHGTVEKILKGVLNKTLIDAFVLF